MILTTILRSLDLMNIPLFLEIKKKEKFLKRKMFQEDFFGYIEYETNLMNLIQLRRDEIGYHHKKGKLRQ